MHQASPLEGPYADEAAAVNPQSVVQWLVEMDETTHELSVEEIRQQVEADTCTVTDGTWIAARSPRAAVDHD